MCPSIRARANRSGHRIRVYRSFRLLRANDTRTIAAGRRRRQPHQTGQIRANRHHLPKTELPGSSLRASEQLARYFTRPKNEPLQGATGSSGMAAGIVRDISCRAFLRVPQRLGTILQPRRHRHRRGQGLAWPPASGTICRPPPIPHQAPTPKATVWHGRHAVGPLLDDCHRYHTQPRPLWSFFCLTCTAGGRGATGPLPRMLPTG